MRSRKRLAWCFALLLPIGRPVAAQVRPAAPPPAADLSSPPPDIQAIIKKLLGGAGPTPDEAKRFNEYDQTHHEVIVRSMNALRDSLMRKAAAPVPTSPTATVTLSGAQTGTLQGPVAASFESAKNASGFGFETQAGTSSVQVTLKIVGTLKAGTYTSTSAAISGAVQVSATPPLTWIAAKGATGDQGAFTLTLTSVSVAATTSDGKAYIVHGSLDATMPAVAASGATGPVTLHATF